MSQMEPNTHSITDFINGFNGGTRANRFKVMGNLPTRLTNRTNATTDFHIRSASIPGSIVGAIPINYRGRTVFYPGDRTYQPWNITILDDIKTSSNTQNAPDALFAAFHEWHQKINDHVSNTTTYLNTRQSNPDMSDHFKSDWTVEQLDTNGTKTLKSFKLWHCWPVAIGPIELDMSQDNTLTTFSVTMLYSHYEILT